LKKQQPLSSATNGYAKATLRKGSYLIIPGTLSRPLYKLLFPQARTIYVNAAAKDAKQRFFDRDKDPAQERVTALSHMLKAPMVFDWFGYHLMQGMGDFEFILDPDAYGGPALCVRSDKISTNFRDRASLKLKLVYPITTPPTPPISTLHSLLASI
jgi:hypothetical protein